MSSPRTFLQNLPQIDVIFLVLTIAITYPKASNNLALSVIWYTCIMIFWALKNFD